jgi:hypothetical protein
VGIYKTFTLLLCYGRCEESKDGRFGAWLYNQVLEM